jgi:hypothetical protein
MTFAFKLEQTDGTPADPSEVRLGVYRWNPATRSRSAAAALRVVDVRDQGEDEPTVLVVEDMAE